MQDRPTYILRAALRRPHECQANSSHIFNEIKALHGYATILTWLGAVSMVRAAFKADGRFHQSQFVSGLHTMADGTKSGGNENRDESSSEEAALSARLGNLDRRLSEIGASRKPGIDQSGNEQDAAQAKASAMAVGLRLSSELVAGVLFGAALGWGFDRLLSTSPWGLIVFLLLGFTAGVINVMRTAGVMAKQSERL